VKDLDVTGPSNETKKALPSPGGGGALLTHTPQLGRKHKTVVSDTLKEGREPRGRTGVFTSLSMEQDLPPLIRGSAGTRQVETIITRDSRLWEAKWIRCIYC